MCAIAAAALSSLREGRGRSRGEALRKAFRQVNPRSDILMLLASKALQLFF